MPSFDEKVLALYATGPTTRQIEASLKEIDGVDVSPTLISKVTDAVLDEVTAWQNRPLDAVYPIDYLDALHLKILTDGRVQTRAAYVALGVTMAGNKDLLGIWIGEAEGAKFWLNVLTELNNSGARDILIASVDGLTGLPEAIGSVFPKAEVQLCIVHMARNSLRYVPWKNRKAVARDLRKVYTAPTAEAAEQALSAFEAARGNQYPIAAQTWRSRWDAVILPGPLAAMHGSGVSARSIARAGPTFRLTSASATTTLVRGGRGYGHREAASLLTRRAFSVESRRAPRS